MAEIGSESRQQALNIPAGTIPRDNSMDGGCVSEVVDTWRTTFTRSTTDTGYSSDLLKQA